MKIVINLMSVFCDSFLAVAAPFLAAGLVGCGSESTPDAPDPSPVVDHYAEMVHENYEVTVSKVASLNGVLTDFFAAPSQAGLEGARKAWIDARTPYGESEVYRFYGGPIDDADGPEGRVNAWPLDEAFVDYVEGDDATGIINSPDEFPEITADLLIKQNEKGGEKNIATGYHAIEFLLWGQDKSVDGPGDRPFTDYVTDQTGTAKNQDRRTQYLKQVTELLEADLVSVEKQWEPGEDNYRATFVKDPKVALGNILKGMGSLAGAELSRERMNNALQEQEQEEEQSCFSDNTHEDLLANAKAIQNAYLGRYGTNDGPGVDDLVKEIDPDLAARLTTELEDALSAIEAIPQPFDQAIVDPDGRAKIQAAIDALQKVTDSIVEVATALDVTLNLEE